MSKVVDDLEMIFPRTHFAVPQRASAWYTCCNTGHLQAVTLLEESRLFKPK